MSTQVQFRRGTTTQNNAFTGAQGEISVDTDLKTIRLHDGTTAGGGSTMLNNISAQTALNKTFSTGSVWQGNAVGLGYGGTGSALTATAGAVLYSTASGLALSAAGTSGQILVSGGTGSPTFVSASSISAGSSTLATTTTNIAGGSAGQLIIQSDTSLTTFITAGAAGTFLKSAGAGYAPTWAAGAVTIGSTTVALGSTITSVDGLDILTSTGTNNWKIPAGTTAQRPATPAVGMIRYNSDQVSFEGYSSGAWSSLGGVSSVDKFTYIRAETSAGASNGELEFFAKNAGGTAAIKVAGMNISRFLEATGTVLGTNTTQALFNTVATTVNAFGAATTVSIGASSGTTTVNNNLVVTGNFTVNGTTQTINATTIQVADKNIEIGITGTPTDITANGGGITLKGATDKTIVYDNTNNNWTSSENWNIPTGKVFKINNTSVLSSSTLGSSVTGSSLTSVGTIGTGVWQGTIVGSTYGGTGVNNGANTLTLAGNVSHAGAFTQTFTATANTTLTLPVTGTLATLANAETLTNKSIAAASNTITGLTNTNLSGTAGITNANLANSTISGIALGGTLNTFTTNVSGVGLSGSATYNGSSAQTFTVTSNATSLNNASTIVARDASGNFTAGTITAALSGNATTSSSCSGNAATATTSSSCSGNAATATTATTANALNTGNNYQVNSIGVGTPASGVAGEIRATNQITAYYSDDLLKTRTGKIENALEKVLSLDGFHYHANETAVALGYDASKQEVGVSAQQVYAVLPEITAPAPIDPQYMTVHYERLIPLLIEAIKEQQKQIEELKVKLGN